MKMGTLKVETGFTGYAGKRTAAVLMVLLALMLTAVRASADSKFAAPHLGIPVSASDTRSRALGGVSTALPGENFSFTNPARTVNFWRSGINGVLSQDYRKLEDPASGEEASLRSTQFHGLRAIFPGIKGFVFSWGVYQWRDMNWEYSDSLNADFRDTKVARTLSSTGGLYVSRLGVARMLAPNLAVGLGVDWLFGSANHRRELDFIDGSMAATREEYENKYSYLRPTFGVLASVLGTSLGFSLTTGAESGVDVDIAMSSGYTDKTTFTQEYPLSWRLGVSRRVTERSVVGFDLEYEGWSGVDLALDEGIAPADQWRYCVGFELLPAAQENPPFYRSFPLRFGYSRVVYPFELEGSAVNENTWSVGVGQYFGNRQGMADVTLQYIKRSAGSGIFPEESVFRIVVGLSAFERWVSVPRRGR